MSNDITLEFEYLAIEAFKNAQAAAEAESAFGQGADVLDFLDSETEALADERGLHGQLRDHLRMLVGEMRLAFLSVTTDLVAADLTEEEAGTVLPFRRS